MCLKVLNKLFSIFSFFGCSDISFMSLSQSSFSRVQTDECCDGNKQKQSNNKWSHKQSYWTCDPSFQNEFPALLNVTFNLRYKRQVIKSLSSNIATIPSICGSLGQQSWLDTGPSVRGIQPSTKPFEKRTEHAFIRFPSHSSRKLRKSCQRWGSFPTSGLELWPS